LEFIFVKNKGIFLKNKNLSSVVSGSAQPQIIRSSLSLFKISLPPLSVQKEIVEKIEVKQKAIDAAKEVIRNLERERERILVKALEE
jgi:restriction endonuclease S subunit